MAKRKSSKKSILKGLSTKVVTPSQNSSHMRNYGEGSKQLGWLALIIGLLYLFNDLGFLRFWTVSWYTLIFLFLGLLACSLKISQKFRLTNHLSYLII